MDNFGWLMLNLPGMIFLELKLHLSQGTISGLKEIMYEKCLVQSPGDRKHIINSSYPIELSRYGFLKTDLLRLLDGVIHSC